MAHKNYIKNILKPSIIFSQSVGVFSLILSLILNPYIEKNFNNLNWILTFLIFFIIIIMQRTTSIPLWRTCGIAYTIALTVAFSFEIKEMGSEAGMWGAVVTSLMITGMSFLFMKVIDYLIALSCIWIIMWELNIEQIIPGQLPLYYIFLFSASFLGVNLSLLFTTYMKNEYYLNERYRKLSETDPLTQAPNRRALMENIEACLKGQQQSNLWFAMLDIDNFKSINDRFGHDKGDETLINFSNLISQAKNLVCFGRLGGEEFGLVIKEKDLCAAVKNIEELLSILKIDSDLDVKYLFSAGLVSFKDSIEVRELLVDADKYLYVAKNSGKGCVAFQKPSAAENVKSHL